MAWMPTNTATRYAMGLPTLPEHAAAAEKARNEDAEIWGSGASKRKSAEDITGLQGEAQRDVAKTQADANIEVAKIRAAQRGYAKGGPVVDVGYKHSNNPMYAKYGATMDSSLLAKSREK